MSEWTDEEYKLWARQLLLCLEKDSPDRKLKMLEALEAEVGRQATDLRLARARAE